MFVHISQLHWLDVPYRERSLQASSDSSLQCLNGRSVCRSTASRSPLPTRGGNCVSPIVTYLLYRISGSTHTAVGRSQLLAPSWNSPVFYTGPNEQHRLF